MTDFLSHSKTDLPSQQHVRFRGLSPYKRELERNGLMIHSLFPSYFFLNSPIDAGGLLGKLLHTIYYKYTVRLTQGAWHLPDQIAYAYLTILYGIDSLLTRYHRLAPTTKLLVATK